MSLMRTCRILRALAIWALALFPARAALALSWPLDVAGKQNDTPIVNTYGQYQDYGSDEYCHPGVDLKAPDNTPVLAGTTVNSVVKRRHEPPPPMFADPHRGITITESGSGLVWAYWHVDNFQVTAGDKVGASTYIADIYGHSANWNHLHLGLGDQYDAANNSLDSTGNPLTYLSYTDTIDPTIEGFRLYPNTAEGVNVFFDKTIDGTNFGVPNKNQILVGERPQAGLSNPLPAGKVKSDIDVAVSAYDQIDCTLAGADYRVGLYRMFYRIDALTPLPSSAGVQRHVTFRFEGTAPNQNDGIQNLLYRDDEGLECDSADQWPNGSTNGKGTFWHIVTNTTDKTWPGDPNSGGLNAAKCWQTKGAASHNPQARSPDGEYNINAYAQDQKVNSTHDFVRARVDNFEQRAWVKGPHATEYTASPQYNLPAEIAAVSPRDFFIGDAVDTKAEELLASTSVTAYLHVRRPVWREGDSLVSGALSSTTFAADTITTIGTTPWGTIWVADRPGTYDIVFDYDDDHVFSYTMDPLIAFRVVPEPGSLTLLVTGAGLILRRRRRRARGR